LQESKCPYCEQPFHDNEGKITEKENALAEIVDQYNAREADEKRCAESIDEVYTELTGMNCLYDTLDEYNESKTKYDKLVDTVATLSNKDNPYIDLILEDSEYELLIREASSLNADVSKLSKEKNKLSSSMNADYTMEFIYSEQARLKELKKQLVGVVTDTNPHQDTVERLKKVFESIDDPRTDEIDKLTVLLTHQNFLLKLLTKKDSFIRQALLDANLPLLNTRLRYYLDLIALQHNVSFTKEMKIAISQFNNPIGYDNLSGGQQARINIAIAFAFRDVVQARHQKINFYILDECLDTGLSNLGVKLAAKMIKNVAIENDLSMYVITHRDEIKSSFDKRLKTILKGGLTRIEFN
jgi:DNA repair exonuclease SbcCD ATPase subunit